MVSKMKYDIIVVGAGVIGTAVAYHIMRMCPETSVLLIEKKERAGAGNTGKSAALYRNIFSSNTSLLLARSSIHYYQQIADKIHLEPIGYLWLFSEEKWNNLRPVLDSLDMEKDNLEVIQNKEIHEILRINPSATRKFPSPYAGLLGHSCGSLSAMMLAEHYLNLFLELGGKVSFGTELKTFLLSGGDSCFAPWNEVRIIGVRDTKGKEYYATKVVSALGAWTQDYLGRIGIASCVYPKKRQLFGLKLENPRKFFISRKAGEGMPAVILPAGGVYIKPLIEKGMMIVGCADDIGRSFDMSNPFPEPEYFRTAIEPVIQHYFPELKYRLFLKWAGYYAYHIPDKNPVVEEREGLIFVSGTSGSGIMKADAIGRIAAARTLGEKWIKLGDGSDFRVSDLSLENRAVENEALII